MNWLDIVLIVVLALATLMGVWRGIISMVIPLAGIIVGIVLAGHFYGTVGGWLPIGNPEYAKWVAYAIIIAFVFIVAVILTIIVTRFVKWAFLGWVDHLGGAVLGLVLGALTCAAVLAACVQFGIGLDFIQGSGIAELLLDWFPAVLALLPGEFDAVREFFE